jgi:uncharacterized iron-regulated membrane protein
MYRFARSLHRWIGLIGSLFMILLAVTGFLLALKREIPWMRPTDHRGGKIESLSQAVTLHEAAEAAFALGIPELRSREDIDRIDYRPGRNQFKIISKEGYHEVQVDGLSGEVLSHARRNDQLTEDIHDLSYFNESFRTYVLPLVGIVLFLLGVTGVVIFFTPVVRRRQFKRRTVVKQNKP